MSVRLARLSISRGESIQIGFEGSVENSVIVGIDKQGNAFVTGPMNANVRTIVVTEEGMNSTDPTPAPRKNNEGRE